MAFHTAKTPQEMLQQVREYLDKKKFATDIVDVVIWPMLQHLQCDTLDIPRK